MSFRQKSNYFTGKKNSLFVQQLFRYMSLWQKFNNLSEKKKHIFCETAIQIKLSNLTVSIFATHQSFMMYFIYSLH